MAIFKDEPSTWQRLDLRLLQNSPITMYFGQDGLIEDTAWLAEHGYRIDRFDCTRWTTEESAHDSLSGALDFPDYYGRNLNAFNDCLGDIDVPEDAGRVLVFTRYDVPAKVMRSFAAALLDIIATQARLNLLFGRRLFALIQSDNPQLEFEPVGACPVMWNPREWMSKTRGL
jgi:RNAse (barnase) inhibitor barstar